MFRGFAEIRGCFAGVSRIHERIFTCFVAFSQQSCIVNLCSRRLRLDLWCASQPTPTWCFPMAMAAVGGLEGSLEMVLGQRKACSCSRMCCNHYTAPLGTPVTTGDDRACGKLASSKYKDSPDHKDGLSAATSASFEHTAIGKPRGGHRSK